MKTLESLVENFIDNIDSAKKTGVVGRYTLDEIKNIKDYCAKIKMLQNFDSFFIDGFLKNGNSRDIYLKLDSLEFVNDELEEFKKHIRDSLYKDFNDNYYL